MFGKIRTKRIVYFWWFFSVIYYSRGRLISTTHIEYFFIFCLFWPRWIGYCMGQVVFIISNIPNVINLHDDIDKCYDYFGIIHCDISNHQDEIKVINESTLQPSKLQHWMESNGTEWIEMKSTQYPWINSIQNFMDDIEDIGNELKSLLHCLISMRFSFFTKRKTSFVSKFFCLWCG